MTKDLDRSVMEHTETEHGISVITVEGMRNAKNRFLLPEKPIAEELAKVDLKTSDHVSRMETEGLSNDDDLLYDMFSGNMEIAEEKNSDEEISELILTEISYKAYEDSGDRNKMGKSNVVLRGVSTKKQNVKHFTSPQKKIGKKNMVQIGEGLYPEKGRKPPGKRGGNVTPKPRDN